MFVSKVSKLCTYKEFSVNHKLILDTYYTVSTHIYFRSGLPVKVQESFLHNRLKFFSFEDHFYITKYFSERKTAKEVNEAELIESYSNSESVKSSTFNLQDVSDEIIVESSDINDFMEGRDSLPIDNLKQNLQPIEPVIVSGSANLNL